MSGLCSNGEIYKPPRTPLPPWSSEVTATRRRATRKRSCHLYEEYGEDCVHRPAGHVCICHLGRPRSQRLFCARDRLGIKPFLLRRSWGDRFVVFASEIKALFELPDFQPRLNRRALPEFFCLWLSLFRKRHSSKGVRKLLPGPLACALI